MNHESNPVLDNHLRQRQSWERISRQHFYSTDKEAHLLATYILEALADFANVPHGEAWPVQDERGDYTARLVVSFSRTQFSIVKCAEESYIIEGATLLRKQMEVVARLIELGDYKKDLERLLRRTPNVGVLKSRFRSAYGPYSEIAHSATPNHLDNLGFGEPGQGAAAGYTSYYPKFSRNSYVLLHNAAHIFLEFWDWLNTYNEHHGKPWDLAEFNLSAAAAMKVMRAWDVYGDGTNPGS